MSLRELSIFIAGITIGTVSIFFATKPRAIQTPVESSVQALPFGLPLPVNDVIQREGYTTCYNRALRTAFWSGELLTRDPPIGKPDRSSCRFHEEKDIPKAFRALLADYNVSGYDRGHLAPAGDMSLFTVSNVSLVVSNIAPQVVSFNRGYWKQFERFTKDLVKDFEAVVVYTGPIFLPKLEDDGKFYVKYEMIGNPANTPVPTHFYKVIVGILDQKPYSAAFVIPNETIQPHTPLQSFLVPIESVERATGVIFFPSLLIPSQPLCSKVKCAVESFRLARVKIQNEKTQI